MPIGRSELHLVCQQQIGNFAFNLFRNHCYPPWCCLQSIENRAFKLGRRLETVYKNTPYRLAASSDGVAFLGIALRRSRLVRATATQMRVARQALAYVTHAEFETNKTAAKVAWHPRSSKCCVLCFCRTWGSAHSELTDCGHGALRVFLHGTQRARCETSSVLSG